jgi:glycosyltransferase involved in cell wall biosynthesis
VGALDPAEPTVPAVSDADVELSIILPCLNEERTLSACISKALGFLNRSGIRGEVVVADNGSTDRSRDIASAAGARVIVIATRGYGAAVLGGIAAAHGRYVIMGDADGSYDFSNLTPFLEKLRAGAALVMGNRFTGRIEPGAMPFLHRFIGTPLLSLLGRLFFSLHVGDFHCGLRGFDRQRIAALNLRTTGMEFASEMIVRTALAGYRIAEVPTTLKPDGRDRPPHLRTWRDGWRNLRFLLLYSPKWLFLYPGLVLLGLGVIGTAVLLPGPYYFRGVGFDIHTFLVACMAVLLGLQCISFAIIAARFAVLRGFLPRSPPYASVLTALKLEHLLIVALCLILVGISGLFWSVNVWASLGFGALENARLLRAVMLSLTSVTAGIQLAFTAFLSGIMDVPVSR